MTNFLKNFLKDESKANFFIACFCALFAFGVALPSIDFPFHPDEGISLCRIESSQKLSASLKLYESTFSRHQPLYFTVLKTFVQIWGHEKVRIKFFNLFIYSLGFFVFYILAQGRLKNTGMAFLLTCLMALFPPLIYYSTYINSFSLLFTISILQYLFFNETVVKKNNDSIRFSFELFLVTSLLLINIHIYSFFIFFIQFIILFKEKISLCKLQKTLTAIALLYFAYYNYSYFSSLDISKIKLTFLSSSLLDSSMLFVNIVLFLFEGGYTFDHSFLYQLFPVIFACCIFISYLMFFKRNRRLTLNAHNYYLFSTCFILFSFFCAIYFFDERNLEFGDIIFIIPPLFLIFSHFLQNLKGKTNTAFFSFLAIYIFFNFLNFRMIYFFQPEENKSLETALRFIKSRTTRNTNGTSKLIYTNDISKAQCHAVSYYESLYFPEKLELKSSIELSQKEKSSPHVLILFDEAKYDFEESKITQSINEPMNNFVLYYVNGK